MTIFKQYESTLELIEGIADLECHPYFDEHSTSEQFDMFLEDIEYFKTYSHDDEVALSETFNNWMDSLCEDGYLHNEQVNNYCYVGKWG